MTADKPYLIVVGMDYSEASELALAQAFQIAGRLPYSEVHIVHVAALQLPPLAASSPDASVVASNVSVDDTSTELQRYVQERFNGLYADGALDGSPTRIVTHVRWETPAQEIAQLAADLEADLVIVGTHGRRGLARALLGSVAEAVVRYAPCPVLVTRPKHSVESPRIEPACPACLREREATGGEQLWCAQHRERHGVRHVYQSSDRVASDGTMPLVFHADSR
jgi:nucleotide-binding universal stress UspA family protein